MTSQDQQVLEQLDVWLNQNYQVWLVTVVETYGSSPRQPGAMLALRADGVLLGSVSGGCIEDELIQRVRLAELSTKKAELVTFGETQEEQQRFKLPCGGSIRLLVEPVGNYDQWLGGMLKALGEQKLVKRDVYLQPYKVVFSTATVSEPQVTVNKGHLSLVYGPRWRMLIIGAVDTSRYLAEMATSLDYQVYVCDPREEMQLSWDHQQSTLLKMMPDDAVNYLQPDLNTAIIALTHDPKLDDMALLEALKSAAFYVGALGSLRNNNNRRKRLELFDLTEQEINSLHGPVGLNIGSKTPAEIAIAILAELIACRYQRASKPEVRERAQDLLSR